MEKEINGKNYNITELKYLDALEVEGAKKISIKLGVKKFLQFSTGLSDEELENLSIKDGLELQKAVNEVNELDFQEPVKN